MAQVEEQALGRSEVDQKILHFEQKVDLEMKPRLKMLLGKRDQVYEQLSQYLTLRNTLTMIREQKLKKFSS